MFGRKLGLMACFVSLFSAQALADGAAEQERMPFLLERGLDLMFRQLPPELQGLRPLFETAPRFESPQIQPNGDIIIRRRRPAPAPLPEGQIEL